MFDPMGLIGVTDDLKALVDLVCSERFRLGKKLCVAEVGTWAGMSALAMAYTQAVELLVCVDNWLGNPDDCLGPIAQKIGPDKAFATFLENTREFLGKPILPLRKDSIDAARAIVQSGLKFDIIFLDARHTYKSVKEDIEAWIPNLYPDGVICGHDYMDYFPGVVRAVEERFHGKHRILGATIWMVRPGRLEYK